MSENPRLPVCHRRGAVASVLAAGLLTLTACGGDSHTPEQRHLYCAVGKIRFETPVPPEGYENANRAIEGLARRAAGFDATADETAAFDRLLREYPDLRSAISREC